MMVSPEGYVVIPNVVPQELVKRLADELDADPDKIPIVRREPYNEYRVPPSGYEIRDHFVKNADKNKLLPLFHPSPVPDKPNSIGVGVFHKTNADPSRLKTANKNEIYVTIAVTDLGQYNGWFTFYEGSHRLSPPFAKKAALNLKAGDAVVWIGNLVYFHSPGGGGKFVTLVYQLSPTT